jgi:hypothetical protein
MKPQLNLSKFLLLAALQPLLGLPEKSSWKTG